MVESQPPRTRMCMLFSLACLLLLLACQTMPSSTTGGNGTTSGDGNNTGTTTNSARLFVVDNGGAVSSYANAEVASGDVAPATNLVNSDFQPAAAAVTKSGQLIETTEGGIFVYDNATTASGGAPA